MTGVSARPVGDIAELQDGVRPVNLRTDLRPLADLIELVFADSMDSNGRSAIREMRYLSHLGYGLKLITRLNELALGISMGYVCVHEGRLVGNVSVYPANYPRELGETWILANVGVHPDYQGRGIAQGMMGACLAMLRRRGAVRVVLQVNRDNAPALALYERYGFRYERAWQLWRRSGFARSNEAGPPEFHITRPRRREWKAEYSLAQAARPNSLGGLGWLNPLHRSAFHKPLWKQLLGLLALNSVEKLIIRHDETGAILASCWLEGTVGFSQIRARLFADPRIDYQPYVAALLDSVIARFARSTIMMEHPTDDSVVNDLLKRHRFQVKRDLWHMRLEL